MNIIYIGLNKVKLLINNIYFFVVMKLPIRCPSCEDKLQVVKLHCSECSTEVSGSYELPMLLQLDVEEQEFIVEFLLSSGSIKEMASKLRKSYPTVRNRLDDLIQKINALQNGKFK